MEGEGEPLEAPSAARAEAAPFPAVRASSRTARYRLDFPVPLPPVTTVSAPRGSTRERRDR